MAAMRRGWGTSTRTLSPRARPSSTRNTGTIELLPQPVWPSTHVTRCARIWATIRARCASIGSTDPPRDDSPRDDATSPDRDTLSPVSPTGGSTPERGDEPPSPVSPVRPLGVRSSCPLPFSSLHAPGGGIITAEASSSSTSLPTSLSAKSCAGSSNAERALSRRYAHVTTASPPILCTASSTAGESARMCATSLPDIRNLGSGK
mmetsp:Transcript_18442/g.44448  ORF Transcript_18442/g.44448 Transcript_18442/m.44448 type:complete len:205 (-) Transcript_18442:398-1012(-)